MPVRYTKYFSFALLLILLTAIPMHSASRRGKRAFANGDYDRALQIFSRDISRDQSNWEAHSLTGIIYIQDSHRDIKKALYHLQTAHENNPEDPSTNMFLFIALVQDQQYSKAGSLRTDSTFISKHKQAYMFYLHKGILLYKRNKFTDAITMLIKSIELEPVCGECRKYLGLSYYGLEDYANADAALSRAVAFFPDDWDIHYALADIYLQDTYFLPDNALRHINQLKTIAKEDHIKTMLIEGKYHLMTGNHKQSLQLYLKAYDIDNKDCEVNIALANIYQRRDTRDLQLSRKHLNFVEENCSHLEDIHILLANYYRSIGQHDRAITEYRTHIGKNSDDISAMSHLAMLYLDRHVNNPRQAINTARKALEINESYFPALKVLSMAYHSLDDYQNSKKYLLKAVDLNANDPEMLSFLADIYFKENDYNKAKNYARRAVSLMPQNLRALRVLGEIAYQEKDIQNAINHLERVIRIRRNDYRASLLLAYLYQEEGFINYRKSYQYAEQALKINPNDANTWKIKGNAYLNDRLLTKALEAFENSLLYNPNDTWVRNQVSDLRRRLGKN